MGAGVAQTFRRGPRQEKIRLITLAHRLAGFVGAGYLRLVQLSSVVMRWDHPRALSIRRTVAPCVYAFWHNKQVYLAVDHRNERIAVMVSKSKDGEYIAQVMKRLGIAAARGSTSKGGDQALREMVSLLDDRYQVGFTPDGPRGPLHAVHGGVVLAAQSTGAPVVPTTYLASNRLVFRSWDRFILPLPLGRVLVAHGRPFTIAPEMPLEEAKQKIHDALVDNERDAEIAFAQSPSWGDERFARVAFFIYSVMSIVLAPLITLALAIAFGFKRGMLFLKERFAAPALPAGFAAPLWFHAASVGEWQALKPVLRELRNNATEKYAPVVITVSTPEARLLVAKEEPSALVTMLPVDVPWLLFDWMERLQPSAVIIVETEIWPNLIRVASRRHVPVFIVNGRLSERSQRRWMWFKPLIRHLLFKITAVFARGDEDAARFEKLGVPSSRVVVAGNTKVDNIDVQTGDVLFPSGVPILIGGSTWPGEEAMLIAVMAELGAAKARLILAPRRLERIDEVRALLEKNNLPTTLYSQVKTGASWTAGVLLVDTLGDLKKLYSSAQVAFMGGSVFPHGGQNPLEPAAAGLPSVFGPSMANFRDEARGLLDARAACQGMDEAAVRSHLLRLMQDAGERTQLGAAAAAYIRQQRGASVRIARRLCELLGNT